jgi:hypothetical protein
MVDVRTSLTHPLQIAFVQAAPNQGRIGITFCPGKHDPNAATGAWKRDLGLDLDEIKKWGASVVLTLVEQQELGARPDRRSDEHLLPGSRLRRALRG